MALLMAVMAMLMMLALGAGVALTTTTETTIAANHRDGVQGLYAAESAVDLAVDRLREPAIWDQFVAAAVPTVLLQGTLADLLQVRSIDSRIEVSVTVGPVAGGDAGMLAIQSNARGPGAIRRNVQVTVRRRPAGDPAGEPVIETLAWREQ